MNLSETLQVDPENCEVALREMQFSHLWYKVRKDKNYLIGWYTTVRIQIQIHERNKTWLLSGCARNGC